jgi:hypothetical protein
MEQLDRVIYMPEKKLTKKKLFCGLWSEHDMSFSEKAVKSRKNGL